MLQGILKPMPDYDIHFRGPLAIPKAGIMFLVDDKLSSSAPPHPGEGEAVHLVTCHFDKAKRADGVYAVPALTLGGRFPLDSQIKGIVVEKKDHIVFDRVAYEDFRLAFGSSLICEPIGGADPTGVAVIETQAQLEAARARIKELEAAAKPAVRK